MAVVKVDTLARSVAEGPTLMTGAIPTKDWMDMPVHFKPGNYAYPTKPTILEYLDSQSGVSFPNAREWSPEDDDWQLPENWKEIIIDGLAQRLKKFRSLKIFMDCCVRCGRRRRKRDVDALAALHFPIRFATKVSRSRR